MSKRFDWWCRTAVDQIRYGPDRKEVYQELYAHLIDRYDAEIERFDEPGEAEEAVLRAMGDANELAVQLAAVHRPFWGYVLTLSRWVLRIAIGLVVLVAVLFLRYNYPTEPYENWYDARPGEPLVNEFEGGTGKGYRVLDIDPDARDSSDGFVFDVSRASMMYYDDYLDDAFDGYSFRVDVRVSSFFQWAELRHIPDNDFWAVDSLGNVYASYNNDGYTWQKAVYGNVYGTGFFSHTIKLWFSNFCSQDAEWIELRYDRSGRDIRLRIDLRGGGTE